MSKFELAPKLEANLLATVSKLGFTSMYPDQEESVLANICGKNTLTFIATGGGKTACYVIPNLVRNRVSVVISPLIALQVDQVRELQALGAAVAMYNSGVSDELKKEIAKQVHAAKKAGTAYFLYVSPESLLTETFYDLFGNECFDNMIIDEIHCVSTWGNSFRPDYMRLEYAAQRLGVSHCEGYTATVTPKILADIYRYTPLKKDACEIIRGDAIRENLSLHVEYTDVYEGTPKEKADRKKSTLLRLAKRETSGAIIVYCSSRNACENLFDHAYFKGRLLRMGYTVYLFHAGIDPEEKNRVMERFSKDERPFVIATNAFGMGINRADVRQVVHYNNPRSLLGYAQEIGRSGRDGSPAKCTAFFDRSTVEQTIARRQHSLPSVQTVENVYESLLKKYKKISAQARKTFSTSKYLRQMEQIIEKNDDSENKSGRLERMRASISLLKQVGLVKEDDGEEMVIYKFVLGSLKHQRLIELTQMDARAEEVQLRLVAEFFSDETHEQSRLWELMEGNI